jgi:S-formylglutathione hydrolase FrmB
VLRKAGHTTALVGTIEYRMAGKAIAAVNTTPESLDLFKMFAGLEAAGGTHATMEVSSHALALARVYGIHFHTAVFSNLTRDHLDFHRTMEEYFAAKCLLFDGAGAPPPDGYPVLWLLHGGFGDDMEWVNETYVERYAQEEKIAVVTIAATNSCYMDTMYGQNYFTMLTEELPDLLYHRFPISDKRKDNAIAGFSMGAAGAVWAAVRCPEKYGVCVAMSGMPDGIEDIEARKAYTPQTTKKQGGQVLDMIYGKTEDLPETEKDFLHMCHVATEKSCGFPTFYLLHGQLDTRIDPRMRKYAAVLHDLGAEIGAFEIIPGLGHEFALCDAGVKMTLKSWMKQRREDC